MANCTYRIETICETFKETTNKKAAIEAAKEISRRRHIEISIYRIDEFGATSHIGDIKYISYLKKAEFFNA